MLGKVELWITPWFDIIETRRNPCGCHPDDYIINNAYVPSTKRKYRDGFSYSFKDRRGFMRMVKQRRWVKLL
jgi:hypothetical protein